MKITLSDGTVIDNLVLNGNNFVSKEEVKEEVFRGNISSVQVDDGDNQYTMNNCVLEYIRQYGEEYWILLREQTEQEYRQNTVEAQAFYTAVMTDTLMED